MSRTDADGHSSGRRDGQWAGQHDIGNTGANVIEGKAAPIPLTAATGVDTVSYASSGQA